MWFDKLSETSEFQNSDINLHGLWRIRSGSGRLEVVLFSFTVQIYCTLYFKNLFFDVRILYKSSKIVQFSVMYRYSFQGYKTHCQFVGIFLYVYGRNFWKFLKIWPDSGVFHSLYSLSSSQELKMVFIWADRSVVVKSQFWLVDGYAREVWTSHVLHQRYCFLSAFAPLQEGVSFW